MAFWVKSPCGMVGRSQGFREVFCLSIFRTEDGQHNSLKQWLLPNNPDSDLTQKNIIRIITTMKILNHTLFSTDLAFNE
jgi:hypothetical protein